MLSKNQIDFLDSKHYFQLKKEVDAEVNKLLYAVQQALLKTWKSRSDWNLPAQASEIPGKIAKGYNYKGYPYQVSDFPSVFEGKDIFSFRVVVWYGNFISINLIITNRFIEPFRQKIHSFSDGKTYLLRSEKIWENDINTTDSVVINSTNKDEVLDFFQKNKSIRLYKLFTMNQINDLERLTIECFNDWFAN